ncbi:MAG TPA: hypothetical protein VK465_04860 [Fibrobacteria bacterium]|nr:hypothetical protein [Fibrobacteria bacterium]
MRAPTDVPGLTWSALLAASLLASVSVAFGQAAQPSEVQEPAIKEEVDDPEDLPMPGFLLPIDGDVFHEPELKVLISLPGDPPAGMVLLVDGYPENSPLGFADGLITVRISGLKSGVHTVTLLLFNERTEIVAREETRFFIRLPEPGREPSKGDYRHFGRFISKVDWKGGEAKGRILSQSELNLKVNGTDTSLSVGKVEEPISQEIEGVVEAAYNVKYKQVQAYAKVLARTDENRFRQPANRISANVKYGPWAALKAGDVYPVYNPLILSGTRVRGGEGALALVIGDKQFASLKVVSGESRREVPAYIARYDTGGVDPRVDTVPGTHAQDLLAARLGFGGGTNFDMGLTVLKARDRASSDPERALNDRLHGIRPVENLVPGVDLRLGFWDGRVQIFGEYAQSFHTKDRSLGAFATDSFDVVVDPKDFEDFFVFNATTRGWQYLVESKTSGEEVDVAGFLNATSAYNAGFVTSIPLPGLVTETEFRYSHLGLEYQSEGNPFLGGNPGDGFTFIQRLVVLSNRLTLGLELGNHDQDLGFTLQEQRTLKAEIRYTPGPNTPSLVLGGGRANIVPVGDSPHQFESSFFNFNAGAYHQFQLSDGRLHATLVYGFTQDDFDLESDIDDPEATENRTHVVNTSYQYKMRNSPFMPKVNYSFSHNGIQEPTHTVALGFVHTFVGTMRLDLTGIVGQYPESNTRNDLSLGQIVNVDYLVGPNQNLRLREKWTQYGNRMNILVGANYERYF